jgi:hypothetical protein
MNAELELMSAVEKYVKTVGLAHCEGVFKVLDGECRDVWVTLKYHREHKDKPAQGVRR